MDGIIRSRGWDKEIPHGVLPMEQLVLGDKWARKMDHAKLLDVRTSHPVSQAILPRTECFATSRPANHAILYNY